MQSSWNFIIASIVLVTTIQVTLLQCTAMMQTSNYRDYESYTNPRLKFKLEYPSDWVVHELDAPALSSLRGIVFFEPLKDEQELQSGATVEMPLISILAEPIKSRNITIEEVARLQLANIRYLFYDFDFNFVNKTNITIGNNTAIKTDYTIVDPFTTYRGNLGIKNGMEVWIIRADTLYTISFFGAQDQYFKFLPAVQNLMNSIRFIE
jgi:PsbP-like protein